MRGHLKKRVAGKLLRRKRRLIFKNRPELMPELELTNREVRDLYLDTAFESKRFSVISRIGGYFRKITRAGVFRYNTLFYRNAMNHIINTKPLQMLYGIKQYFALKTMRSLYRTKSNRYFRKKEFRMPRPSEYLWTRHVIENKERDCSVPHLIMDQETAHFRGFAHNIVEKEFFRFMLARKRKRRRFFRVYARTLYLRSNSRKYRYLLKFNKSLNMPHHTVELRLFSAKLENHVSHNLQRALNKTVRLYENTAKTISISKNKRKSTRAVRAVLKTKKRFIGRKLARFDLIWGALNNKISETKRAFKGGDQHIRKLSSAPCIIKHDRNRLRSCFRVMSGIFDYSSANRLSNKLNADHLKSSMLAHITGLPVVTDVGLSNRDKKYVAAPYVGETDSEGTTEWEFNYTDRLLEQKRAAELDPVNSLESQKELLLGVRSNIFIFNKRAHYIKLQYGNAGNIRGAFLLHKSRKRNRRNHYTKRMLKYRKAFAYRYAIKWALAIRQKAQTRGRLEFLYANEPITIAPKVNRKLTYRATMLGNVFKQIFADTFTYVFFHKTFLDNIANVAYGYKIKSYVLPLVSNDREAIKELTEKIKLYNETLNKSLKVKRSKNKPDYCYFLNARLYWDSVITYDYTAEHDSTVLVDILSTLNYCVLSALTEQYKLLETLLAINVITND